MHEVGFTHMSREVDGQIPPVTDTVGAIPHLTWRGILLTFSTDPVLSGLHLIMTGTGSWDGTSSEACGRSILVNSQVNSGQFSGQFWSIFSKIQ